MFLPLGPVVVAFSNVTRRSGHCSSLPVLSIASSGLRFRGWPSAAAQIPNASTTTTCDDDHPSGSSSSSITLSVQGKQIELRMVRRGMEETDLSLTFLLT